MRVGDINRNQGWVLSDTNNEPALDTARFTAQIIIVNALAPIKAGYTPHLYCHQARVPICFQSIIATLDKKTGAVLNFEPE